MSANPVLRRLLGRGAIAAGLALAALGFAGAVAAASPSQPKPADDPFLPVLPTPVTPTAPDTGTLLTNAGSMLPLLGDAGSFLSAGADPGTLVTDTQNLLNDAGNLIGIPDTGSYLNPAPDANAPAPDPNAPLPYTGD
jgi:hypothetical protein